MPPIETTIDSSDESPDSFAKSSLVTAELVSDPVVDAALVPRWKRALASAGRWSLLLILALMTFGFLSSGLSPDPSAIFDEDNAKSAVAQDENVDDIGRRVKPTRKRAIRNSRWFQEKLPSNGVRSWILAGWKRHPWRTG